MRRRIKLALFAIALIVPASCNLRQDHLTFRAKVADIQHSQNSLIQNKQPGDYVEVTLPGKLLNPLQAIPPVSRGQADWSTVEQAAASAVSANLAGDIPWIIENYVPADRAAIARQLADPDAARRNREYYRNLGKISETGWTEIHGYTVVFLQGVEEDGDATLISIPLSKTSSGWKQTNSLANDDTFELVWTALHTGGVR